MAAETLKRLWKNEYLQTAVVIALEFVIVFGLYFGASAMLGTEYPALAVASGSMLPTLNIGDLIIVQKVDPANIHADYLAGDVLVYKRGSELIVHRAVKIEFKNGVYWVTTRGDNNYIDDPSWPSTMLIGKVIARIPYVGNFPLFFHSERNMHVLLIIILIILILLILPSGLGSDKEQVKEERKSGKIRLGLIYFVAINLLIIGLMVFSLWGEFTFWQPGASPQRATIYGVLKDLWFHESFSSSVLLQHGFMTYRIDWQISGGTRVGIPTFSWFQLLLLVLIIFNALKVFNSVKERKLARQTDSF